MEFSPFNPVVKLCLQGMEMEQQNQQEKALHFFTQAWEEASNDFEKFLAAHYIARRQQLPVEQKAWLETALNHVLKVNDNAATSALPSLYQKLSDCCQALAETEKAREYENLAMAHQSKPSDHGPFYHGTRANLQTGDLLVAGGTSNYQQELKMNHIYFTAMVNGAGLAAALAKGESAERVYIVEPTGDYENDPNVTDKKFPGNPTRSYRSQAPLKIIGEVTAWEKPAAAAIQQFKQRVENNKGEIIN